MMKKKEGKKEKEKRSKKWAGPAHQAAHVPVPLLAWLILIPSRALSRSPPLIPPPFIPPRRRFPLLLCHLRSSLRCSAPLPRCSPSRSTAAAVPFQIEQPVARRRRNRADGGEETAESTRASIRIDEEMAESRGRQLALRRQGATLPLRRAWSAQTLKRCLSDALISLVVRRNQ